MNDNIYKVFAILTIVVLIALNVNIFAGDTTSPVMSVKANTSSVTDGGAITYTVTATDEEGIASFILSNSNVKLNGFTANAKYNVISANQIEVILTNVQGTNGSKNITIAAGAAMDFEENKSVQLISSSFTLTNMDKVAPSIGVVSSKSNVIDGGAITYTVTATDNEEVASFILSDSNVKLNGFTATTRYNQVNANKIEVVLTNIRGTDGTKSITIASGAAMDAVGNKTPAVTSTSFTLTNVDSVAPSIVITKNASSVKDGGNVTFRIVASDNAGVASFVLSDANVKLNGFTATVKYNQVSANTVEVVLTNIQGTNGAKNITVLAGAAVDFEGNKTPAITSTSFTLTNVDRVAPSMVITKNTSSINDGGSVTYTVTVADNEGVASFVLSDANVKLNGFTAAVKYNVVSANKIEVVLTNIQGTNGAKNITVLAGAAMDAAGNKTPAVTSTSFTLTNVDRVAPSIIITKNTSSVNDGGSVTYTVTVADNEGVASFVLSDANVKLNGFTATVKYNVVSANKIEVVLTNIQGTNGAKNITVLAGAAMDAAGNKTPAVTSTSFTLTNVDRVAPSIIITKNTSSVNDGGSVTYTVTVADNEGIASFILSDANVKLNGFTATVKYNVVSANKIEVVLTNIQGTNGAKNITVLAGVAVDFEGNKTPAVTSTNFTLTNVDRVAPSIIITKNTSSVNDGGSVTYTVTVADNEGIASFILADANVKLNGFTATVKYNVVSANKIEVVLTNIQGTNGAKNITVLAGAAVDFEGNKTPAITSTNFTLTNVDRVAPSIIITKNISSVNDGGSVTYTVTVADNEGVASFILSDANVKLNGFTAAVKYNVVSANKIEVVLTNIQGTNGTKNITVLAGAAVDFEGNKTPAVTSTNFTLTNIDRVKPEIVIVPNVDNVTDGGSITYTVTAIDNIRVANFEINQENLVLNGFTATISIKNIGTNKYQIILTNVQGTDGDKNITILAGAAVDAQGNKSDAKTSASFTLRNEDRRAPTIKIDGPDNSQVLLNGKVTYIVTVADDTGIKQFSIKESDIKLNGFTAKVIINKLDNTTIQIILLNIKGTVGNKNITVASGVAQDLYGNKTSAITSNNFKLIEKKPSQPIKPGNNMDTYLPEVSGTLNSKLKGFTAWLRSRKDNEVNVNKYNFITNDTEVTYVIEFYNASTKAEENMVYTLTIPYNVQVISTIGGGKIIVKNENSTVIQWSFDTIPSKAYGTVEAKVKYTDNKELAKTEDIYEIFYAKLNILNENYNFNSFLQQLYIDVNATKQAQQFGYVNGFENGNMLYVEDEITRLELARLIINSGLVVIDEDTEAYKEIKEYKLLSEEDRLIIGTLIDLGIMEVYQDATFKANNPILMDEMIKVFAKLTEYVSGSKLQTKASPYIYEEVLKNSYGELVENRYYIMELIRQNVISLNDINVDKYATRLDAINILNTLTYREEIKDEVSELEIEYVDVLPEVTYFWDIVTALENYIYTYNNKLEQVIVKYED